MNILSLDVGTTSMRGILYNEAGCELAMESVSTPLIVDQQKKTMEQSPDVYIKGLIHICKVIADSARVDAISITAFRSAPTLVDKEGQAICNFIMWQDTRNAEICNRLRSANSQIYQTCGASINTVFTASKITWWAENERDLYKHAFKAMIVPDYLIHAMTGVFATDYTYGSRTLLMDIRTLQWDADMCRLFGIEQNKLCDLQEQGAICGKVTKAFSQQTGITQGTPVISAGGDQQCGALGLGVLDENTIEVNSGTGSFVISLTDYPVLDNSSVITNVAAVPGMYTQEMNIIASASALNWLVREFFPQYWGEKPDFSSINRIAEQTPPGANGIMSIPHFQGCGSRDWNPNATAGFWGFHLGSNRNELIRALYEGIACEVAKSIDALPPSCRNAKEIAVAGGLSRSHVYLEILRDMTNRRLVRGQNDQATARGAFLSAAVTLGLYSNYRSAHQSVTQGESVDVLMPNPEIVAFYQSYKEKTEKLYRCAGELTTTI